MVALTENPRHSKLSNLPVFSLLLSQLDTQQTWESGCCRTLFSALKHPPLNSREVHETPQVQKRSKSLGALPLGYKNKRHLLGEKILFSGAVCMLDKEGQSLQLHSHHPCSPQNPSLWRNTVAQVIHAPLKKPSHVLL